MVAKHLAVMRWCSAVGHVMAAWKYGYLLVIVRAIARSSASLSRKKRHGHADRGSVAEHPTIGGGVCLELGGHG